MAIFLFVFQTQKFEREMSINPLTAGTEYIRFFIFYYHIIVLYLKHANDKMWHQLAIFEKSWPPCCEIWIIFTHLNLWIPSARHNFMWVKIAIE